jgi:hypothetical protein
MGGEIDGRKDGRMDGRREDAILLGAPNGGASDFRRRQDPY